MARPPMARSTMAQVARAAEVSVTTVSRAFGNPERINAQTRAHVLAVAAQLGYRPDPTRTTAPARKDTIALIVSDIANPHFVGMIRGATRQAAATDSSVVLGESEHHPETEQALVERLCPSVDGFLLAASRLPQVELRELAKTRPVVLIDREAPGIPSVVIECETGTRRIVEHLASLGHRSIVALSGPVRTSWPAAKRWKALQTTAAELGIEVVRLGPFTATIASGPAAADAAVVTGATAIVAHNDLLALGVLRRLAERGIDVPEDISVVGYDNILAAEFCNPPLTTLGGPTGRVGRAAVDLLLRMIREPGRPLSETRLEVASELVIRGSTASARR